MREQKLVELLDLCLQELLGDCSQQVTRRIAIDHALTRLRRNGLIDKFKIKFLRMLPENARLAVENKKLKEELKKRQR